MHVKGSTIRVAAQTVLSSSASSSDTSITVLSPAAGAVRVGCLIQVGFEVMGVSAVSGGTLTVTRGEQSTTAGNYSAGSVMLPLDRTVLSNGGDLAAGGTSVIVASASFACVTGNSFLLIGGEIVKATAVSGDTLTLTRGLAGTSAVVHADRTTVAVLDMTVTTGALTAADTSVTLASGGAAAIGIVDGQLLVITDEIMRVLTVAGDALTVKRGVGGTAAGAQAAGAKATRRHATVLSGAHSATVALLTVAFAPDVVGLQIGDYLQVRHRYS